MKNRNDELAVMPCKPSAERNLAVLGNLARTQRTNLYRFILRQIHDPVESEELAQQSFFEAVKGVNGFREESELKTWLYGIAAKLVLNHLRRSPQLRYRFESEDVLDMISDQAGDPSIQMERRDFLDRLQCHINALPEEMRRTLDMVLQGESSYADAATSLGIPVGTVRSRISTGRSILKRKLKADGFFCDGTSDRARVGCVDAEAIPV